MPKRDCSATSRIRNNGAKAYYYQSSRGLPNATTYYYDYSSQHLWDKNVFVQSQYKKEFSRQWVFQTSAKWNWSYQRYLDPDYKGSEGKTENSYYQQEYYLSASALYRVLSNLSFSLSTDASINRLNANLKDFAYPTRYSWLTAFAGKYVNDWLTASARYWQRSSTKRCAKAAPQPTGGNSLRTSARRSSPLPAKSSASACSIKISSGCPASTTCTTGRWATRT